MTDKAEVRLIKGRKHSRGADIYRMFKQENKEGMRSLGSTYGNNNSEFLLM